MSYFNLVATSNENTVVTKYEPAKKRAENYQSEAELEREFIQILTEQGYEYLPIHAEADLIANLRAQLEKLNDFRFSDTEWERFFAQNIANDNDDLIAKTRRIQEDPVQNLKRDDGTTKNIKLIDKNDVHRNSLQVINQYAVKKADGAAFDNRYDVTVLVNGLPLVHIELKRRGVALREAFNQIDRYARDSFWAGSGLFEYVQIFVISNGTETKYYSNTTRDGHLKERAGQSSSRRSKSSHSFEFTSFWADAENKNIPDLVDFAQTFFARHTILNILTKFCVFTVENKLLVMRPYQIVATERILNRIEIANNYKKMGTIEAGGYIWHTTGSGKTLTSFKTAQLATKFPFIDKVLFVVDRKDLDYQTMKEYDKFEKGAVSGNTSTKVLTAQLSNPETKIIVTTIQKLSLFVRQNADHAIYTAPVVIIFDECHRSQFGEMHDTIIKKFKNYCLFGFTGTPIFAPNAPSGWAGDNTHSLSHRPIFKTTEQVFGVKLHTYTIVDAINDGNVLPFRIDYLRTMREKPGIADKQVSAIDRESAFQAPARVQAVTKYILEHFAQKTRRNDFYNLKGQRVNGFNALFAVASIPLAQKYYDEFRRQLGGSQNPAERLKIATIFSSARDADETDGLIPDETMDPTHLDLSSRKFLESAIADYNREFRTAFGTTADEFQNYYKDVSEKMKNKELDLLIVVNMFLTGFDAPALNTLFVDKNLRMHGLLQAFSRTNRILNRVKTFGNIVCFRDLREEVDEAIALFGDKDAKSIVVLREFNDYYYGYDENGRHHAGFTELIAELKNNFALGTEIQGEEKKKDFIKLFNKILRQKNILTAFDTFAEDPEKHILSDRDFQDYQSLYLDLYDHFRPTEPGFGEKESIADDLVFEIGLLRQDEINVDYILTLIAKYHAGNCENRELLGEIDSAVSSSQQLRSKKELVRDFINIADPTADVHDSWHKFVKAAYRRDLDQLIADEDLVPAPTRRFMRRSLADGEVKTAGTDIVQLLPPTPRFSQTPTGENLATKKDRVIAKFKSFFEKFFGI